MGIVYLAVLKKDNKGEYSETVGFDYENGITFSLNNALSVLRLGNKNYLLVQETDYSDKTFSGVSIYAFKDGKFAECAVVDIYSKEKYTIEKGSDYPVYNEYLKSINIDDLIKNTKNGEVKFGTAEKYDTAKSVYEADLNNDGKKENFEKYYKFTSTYYGPSQLDLKFYDVDSKINDSLKMIVESGFNENEERKNLQQFWCDSFSKKNLINVLYRFDFDPVYHLEVYLLENMGEPEKMGWIKATPERNIGVKYFKYSLIPARE